MPYLAAFAPSHWTVFHIDEAVRPVDFKMQADLVAITFHTPSAPHAYALATRFRERRIPVVLGGPHVTLMPDEAQAHADVIFVGEAESHWPQFLSDFESGRHGQRYCSTEFPTLEQAPMSRKDLFHRRDHTGGVLFFATHGCVHGYDFCTLAVMYRSRVRKRSIAAVAEECGSFSGKVIILWDDNIASDVEYAKTLFKALTPHRKWWSSQASIHVAQDDEFLELAAKSGCKQLFVGLESISQASVNEVHKELNRVADYARAIFGETVDFLEAAGVRNATSNILTPFPGTLLHQLLEAEGRILTRDWSKYNGRADVVFRPRQMSPEELLAGYQHANRRFYSWRSVCGRLLRSPVELSWTLPLNLAYVFALWWSQRVKP